MDNLEFRKFLTDHGIAKEEYESMTEEEQQEIKKKYNKESTADGLNKIGKGFQGCGCLLLLIPILIGLIYLIVSMIT